MLTCVFTHSDKKTKKVDNFDKAKEIAIKANEPTAVLTDAGNMVGCYYGPLIGFVMVH